MELDDEVLKREAEERRLLKKNPDMIGVLLSKERTLLSRERTTISIAQLALGIAALGLVVVRFFADVSHEWFLAVGWGLVAIAVLLFYHSFKEYRHFQNKLWRLHQKRGHLDELYGEE